MTGPLKKELNFLDVFSIASGAMISSGLFILPALAYARCGSGVFLAYILAGLFVLPAMLSKAELATAMPRAGGTYFFIDRSLGPPMGTLGGISGWFSLSFKSAFALVGLGIFFELLSPGISYFHVKLISSGFLLFFILLNLVGVKEAARIQNILVISLLMLLVAYLIGALPHIQAQRYTNIVPDDLKVLFSTAGFVFIAYGGLTKIASIAEEVKNPGKTIPLAMVCSWGIVGFFYSTVVFVTVGLLSPETLASTHTPISLGAKVVAGNAGLVLLTIAGVLAFVSTANAGILASSRSPMAMARDGLIPAVFSRTNSRFQTPHYSILFTGLFMLAVILFLDLEHLVEVASSLKILLFIMANLSVIVMRESRIPNYRPEFKSPLYPWVQILGILGPIFLLLEFGFLPLFITIIFLLAAFIWYWIYARPRVSRESGLLYLVQRILSRHLEHGLLRKELREIIRERDDIVEDRIDEMIHECIILDLEECVTLDDFFREVSRSAREGVNLSEDFLYDLLWERERESSTAIIPGLAIPHIIVPGENKFEILLARCRGGIIFDDATPPIHTVFVLLGTQDERNFHLKVLAAIAQIAQDTDFDSKWQDARNAEELRDAVLLAKRRRS